MNLNHNQAVVHIDAPQDTRILELNEKLNKTYVTYSAESEAKKEIAIQQDDNAKSFGTANKVARAVFKGSAAYAPSSYDLIEAVAEEPELLDDVAELELPEEFDGLEDDEVIEKLNEKKIEREQIINEINSLNVERIEYIKQQKSTMSKDNGLDEILINAIKEQACSKKFEFE